MKNLLTLVVCAILAIACVGGKGRKASSAVTEIPPERVMSSDWQIVAVGQGVVVSSSAPKAEVAYHDQVIFPDVLIPRTDIARFTAIDIKTQRLACYEYGQLVRVCDIDTPRAGREGLLGDWNVICRTEQPLSVDTTPLAMHDAVAIGGGHWIYEGTLVGHGSIRMSAPDAKWYFDWVKKGDVGYSYLDVSMDRDFKGRAPDDQDRRFKRLLMK